jgi:ribonuclease-3
MKDIIDEYDPRGNTIGLLQEYFQQRGEQLPVYEETSRTGPDHRPQFTVRVRLAGGRGFEGSGPSLADARRQAAQKALDTIRGNG